jgi:hypothetical protein
VPLSVKVQLRCLFPPLEQAPDPIASRPFDTVNVIAVPVANGAEPLLPTATLIPVGFDVTRSPLRPLAVTVSVAFCGGGGGGADGDTVTVAVLVAPLRVAVMVTVVDALTALVETVNEAAWFPPGTVTLAGTLATPGLLLDSDTATPPAGAAAARTAAPCVLEPPTTGEFTITLDSVPCGGVGVLGVTVSVPLLVVPL